MKEKRASIILLLIGGLFSCRKSEVAGGPCVYADDPVTITVKKIEKEDRREDKNASAGNEILTIGYEMTFDKNGIQNNKVVSGEIEIESAEAKTKKVEAGKKFHASIHRLVSGTCPPEPGYPEFQEWK